MTAVIRCENCGGEVDEGVAFCPQCGKPSTGEPERAGALELVAPDRDSPRAGAAGAAVAAPTFGGVVRAEPDKSRRVIWVTVIALGALLVAGLAYLATRPSAAPGEERLEGAMRPGSPDFPGADKLVVEFDPDEDAFIGANALGNYVVTLKPTVRNFTGRAITGLEFRAAGTDVNGKVIRERTFARDVEIEPNRVASPSLGLNFPSDNRPAQLKLQLTGVRFR